MKLILKLIGLLLLISAVQADSLTTIQLRNRPAAEVIPVVEPMLKAGDAISGHGFKIFLRASTQTASEVKAMIAALDSPAKVLQISVFQGSTRGLSELGFGGSIRIEGDNANVQIGSGNTSGSGGSITYGTNSASGSISGISTRKRLNDNPIHQIRVSEGREAYIETGQQIPFFAGTGWVKRKGVVGGVDYKNVVTGFYVLPRVNGDNVILQVSPFKNTPSNAGGGNIETQSANTTITGPIGDWLLIGGVTEQLKQKQSGTGTYTSTQSRNNESIWIKADLVR